MSVVENVEKIILEVERRPSLYKKQSKEYSDKHLKERNVRAGKKKTLNFSVLPGN
jgi:hypothetical protein